MSVQIEKLFEPLALAGMKIKWLPEIDEKWNKAQAVQIYRGEFAMRRSNHLRYGCVASPAGKGPFPAILHIHGGGQTCDKQAVCEWVAEGYTAMSFDWTGTVNTERHPEEVMSAPKDFGNEIDIPSTPGQFLGHAAAR